MLEGAMAKPGQKVTGRLSGAIAKKADFQSQLFCLYKEYRRITCTWVDYSCLVIVRLKGLEAILNCQNHFIFIGIKY
jgi:hypothetical protein